MEIKYFKKIYSDRVACGKWVEGDAINYNDGENYTIEIIEEAEYESIRSQEPSDKEKAKEKLSGDLKWSDAEIDVFIGNVIESRHIPQELIDKYNNRKIEIDKIKDALKGS